MQIVYELAGFGNYQCIICYICPATHFHYICRYMQIIRMGSLGFFLLLSGDSELEGALAWSHLHLRYNSSCSDLVKKNIKLCFSIIWLYTSMYHNDFASLTIELSFLCRSNQKVQVFCMPGLCILLWFLGVHY